MQHPLFSYIVAPIIYMLIRSLTDNAEIYHNSDRIPDRFRATYYEHEDTFDFVIVGAGSSGALLANRLVLANFKVLLLEAGGETQPGQYIPATSLLLLNKKYLDWSHKTVPQTKAFQSSKNKQSLWSAGKGLGGTSLLNFMQYSRGHRKDFERWANETGDPSWNFDGVIPHFKAFEDFHDDWDSREIHGRGGEVTVKMPPYIGMGEYFVKAGVEKGYQRRDLNGDFDEGFSPMFYNIQKNGRRLSTYTAFIEPIRANPNLTIYKFAEVTKILLRGPENEAYGVNYIRHGVRKTAFARNEVIISAGVINSPKLLMLSGIGPREHLESLGIETKVDLPGVGENLQDHPCVYLGPFLIDKPVSMLLDRDVNSETLTEFMDYGTGPLTTSGTVASALISSTYAKENGEGNWPDIQLILIATAVYAKMDLDLADGFGLETSVMKKYLRHAKGLDSFQVIVSVGRPFQRGRVWLKSTNPLDEPYMDPKYLHDERDLNVFVDAIKRTLDLVENTTVFNEIGARHTTQVFPGCEGVEFRGDDYWRCFIREYTISLHHIVGTCKMGKADAKDSVVDPELKVIKAKNLRIMDASVMPFVPVGNTHAPAMMIAQKGSQSIIQAWTKSLENEVK